MRLLAVVAVPLGLSLACVHRLERTVTPQLVTVDHEVPYLKVHMKNGDLFVLSAWQADEPHKQVTGRGEQLGADRVRVHAGEHRIAMADVALYETNTIVTSPSIAAMAVVTGASIALSVVCLANPKACFGSCPTFYAPGAPGAPGERGAEDVVLQAEGFSDAISPALERHDVDALWRTHVTDGRLTLRMTNGAYETHVVKQADVLAVPRPPGTRVLATGEALWLASAVTPPTGCTAPEGDCTGVLAGVDGRERTSLADPHDLAARETIDLAFPAAAPAAAPASSSPRARAWSPRSCSTRAWRTSARPPSRGSRCSSAATSRRGSAAASCRDWSAASRSRSRTARGG
jgi:hypothetical protein